MSDITITQEFALERIKRGLVGLSHEQLLAAVKFTARHNMIISNNIGKVAQDAWLDMNLTINEENRLRELYSHLSKLSLTELQQRAMVYTRRNYTLKNLLAAAAKR